MLIFVGNKIRKMKRDDFRLLVDLHYPDLKNFIADFNNMGGNIDMHILQFHLDCPNRIEEGWLSAYNMFFQSKLRFELTLANIMVGDKVRNN